MLQKVNVEELLADRKPRENFNLFWVDDRYTLRVAKVEGTFPWHRHPDADEGWFVYEGQVTIQTENGDITLRRGDAVKIPKGLRHAPRADVAGSIVMIVNGKGFHHVFDGDMTDEKAGFTEKDVSEL